MKLKRVKTTTRNAITYITTKVPERCVKINYDETKEVPDEVGYEMLKEYKGLLVEVKDEEKKTSKSEIKRRKIMNNYSDKAID